MDWRLCAVRPHTGPVNSPQRFSFIHVSMLSSVKRDGRRPASRRRRRGGCDVTAGTAVVCTIERRIRAHTGTEAGQVWCIRECTDSVLRNSIPSRRLLSGELGSAAARKAAAPASLPTSGGGRPGKGSDSCSRCPRGVSAAVCTVYIGIISPAKFWVCLKFTDHGGCLRGAGPGGVSR